MKWQGRRRSENVEDRRGMGTTGKVVAGGGFLGIVILLLNMFGGENAQMITPVLEQMNQNQQTQQVENKTLTDQEKLIGEFVETNFALMEDTWAPIFQENNLNYRNPKMVLFTNAVETACGSATAASGPFYCPGDEKVYMDMVFFEELRTRFGAKGGDFAIAYVMAHEFGHHYKQF